jgi:tetratricopeptide (TPR) repeat protein
MCDLAACFASVLALAACGSKAVPVAGAPAAPVSASPSSYAVPRTVITPLDAATVDEMFNRARADFEAKRYADAARGFDRLAEVDPDGPHAEDAFFFGAAAHDELAEFASAAARYQEVARRYPHGARTREALVRAVRLLGHVERYREAGDAADLLLLRLEGLTPLERVVAYGGKALAVVASDAPDSATYFISKARDIIDAERLDAAGAVPRDLAQVYFALGELRRIRGERIGFDPLPPRFAETLEERCQLLLDAQSAYSDTMRAYDAHWSAMAGYRVGELYQRLHEELMRVKAPASADTAAKAQLFEGAMRLRYSVLLQKGLAMMEHTVTLAERTGEQSGWVLRAAESKRALQKAMVEEDAALRRLPYTREQLERALDDLAKKKANGKI